MCGEQPYRFIHAASARGSPPRVRGTVHAPFLAKSCNRITPACAGNSRKLKLRAAQGKDHPRVCGEQFCPGVVRCGGIGSPPRVRGTVSAITEAEAANRITPACAGNRGFKIVPDPLERDHPRVCGEQIFAYFTWFFAMGSPPRVRGTVIFEKGGSTRPGSPPRVRGTGLGGSAVRRRDGITPACAGNSCTLKHIFTAI